MSIDNLEASLGRTWGKKVEINIFIKGGRLFQDTFIIHNLNTINNALCNEEDDDDDDDDDDDEVNSDHGVKSKQEQR